MKKAVVVVNTKDLFGHYIHLFKLGEHVEITKQEKDLAVCVNGYGLVQTVPMYCLAMLV